jgi:hypothetical protein
LPSSKEARQQFIDEWEAPIGESIVSNRDFLNDIRATFVADNCDECRRLKLSEEEIEPVVAAYQQKLESMAAAIAA